jgi:hypothetical protein
MKPIHKLIPKLSLYNINNRRNTMDITKHKLEELQFRNPKIGTIQQIINRNNSSFLVIYADHKNVIDALTINISGQFHNEPNTETNFDIVLKPPKKHRLKTLEELAKEGRITTSNSVYVFIHLSSWEERPFNYDALGAIVENTSLDIPWLLKNNLLVEIDG